MTERIRRPSHYPDPTPFRKVSSRLGAAVLRVTSDGGVVVYFPDGGVLALRRDEAASSQELEEAA